MSEDRHAEGTKDVVIVGAGFGGLRCARELAKHEKDVRITLIDRHN